MDIKVLGSRVVLKKDNVEEATSSGIILAPSAQEPVYQGVVVAVGPGMVLENGSRIPLEVAIGDRVIYSQFAGIPISLGDDSDLLVLNEADIVAVITK